MSNLLFSFNAVMPVFLLVGIGWFVRRTHLVGESFIDGASKLNFRTGLPALLFLGIYQVKGTHIFDWKFIAFMTAGCLGSALILCLTVPKFIRDKKKASAMIHTIFKPNIIILGYPMAMMIFGSEHCAAISMLLPVLIPVNNIVAVLILCSLDPENQGVRSNSIRKAVNGVVKNPIILAAVAAVLLRQGHVPLPTFLLKLLTSLSNLATPLALITLGAQMTMKSALSNRRYVASATALKVFVTPLVMVSLAVALGFRSYELVTAFMISASPSAVNCYMLAREMHSDEVLTGEIILSTTLCSMFIFFFGILIFKNLAILS